MSSENKEKALSTLDEPIKNVAYNLSDKLSQNIGTSLADIWYLVFGGISQVAEKRKLTYRYALQEFKNELEEKIESIPEEKKCEADIQVVGPALESAKHCMNKKELRNLYATLISNSVNLDTKDKVHPFFSDIIKVLTPEDAKLLKEIYLHNNFLIFKLSETSPSTFFSLSVLDSVYTR